MLQPTRITEIISDHYPAINSACDVAASGIGGVHFVPTDTKETPLLWQQRFPDWICQDLCLFVNPKGSITNSKLKLAGSIAHNDILAQAANVREKTTHNSYDNITAIFWQRKGATTTLGQAAFLFRLQALHQQFFCYILLCDYIPGSSNAMADFLS